MSIKFEELAIELNTTVGQLTTLAEILNEETSSSETPLNLPIGAKVALNNEDAAVLRNEFKKRQANVIASATPQLNPAPIRNTNTSDIQQAETGSVPVAQDEDPTASNLELAYEQLTNARAAQDTQAQEILEKKIRTLRDRAFRRGIMLRVAAETSEIEGYLAAGNAIDASNEAGSAEAFNRETELIAGKTGESFLPNPYPNAAESSTQIPPGKPSISPQNLSILDRLKTL